MTKQEQLDALKDEMARDASLPLATNLIFGEGNPDCDVLFVGEAPGMNEDIQTRPFVGRGGQLLRQMIREIGWREEDVYITNIVKRRPPDNRDPLPEEIAAYQPYLTRQIEIIDSKVIVALGRFSMNYFLPDAKITRDQGKAFRLPRPFDGSQGRGETVLIVPVFHPAAALRNPEVKKEFEASFKKLPDIIAGKGTAIVLPPARKEPPGPPPQPKLF